MSRGDEVYYLGGDHLGSTSLTTDDTGTIISEVRYLPYGEERWNNGASVTDFGFTAQRSEKSFGLMDYNARYYSPVLGRFISPDSLVPDPTSSGGFNRYRYARNNPLKYTDPSGHCVVVCAVIFLAGLALIVSTDQAMNDDIVAAEAAEGRTDYLDTYPSEQQVELGLTLMTLGFLGGLGQGGLVEEPPEEESPGDNPLTDGPSDTDNVTRKPNEELEAPPSKRGNAPIGADGIPIELHHDGQEPDSPLIEYTREEHRGQGNFKKNHPNTGQEPSKIDRKEWKKQQKDYWKKEWDEGRFDDLQ